MKLSRTLTAITAAGVLTAMSLGGVAMAEVSDSTKVDATELQSDIQLHPMLGAYGLSVVPMEDGSLVIEGMIDDQQGYDALNQLIKEKNEDSESRIKSDVIRS